MTTSGKAAYVAGTIYVLLHSVSAPPDPLARALNALAAGTPLGEDLTAEAFDSLMRGAATPAQTAALLFGLRLRGESAAELAGAARALRRVMLRVTVPSTRRFVIDTCGTGGGTVTTFNISTAAALVAVGAGATVAKHGNRSYTSKCGSADVFEALGAPLSTDAEQAARLLDTAGMAFLFAPAFHPAMKFVGPVRKELGVATIMNLIGPLANPAMVTRQLLGVADPARGPIVAEALNRLGAEHALVVHAQAGMDEIAPAGRTTVWEIRGGRVTVWELDPADFGLEVNDLGALAGGEPPANAARVRRLLESPGDDASGRAAVLLNAGAAIYVAGIARDFKEGIERARAALEGGAARGALERVASAGVSTSG